MFELMTISFECLLIQYLFVYISIYNSFFVHSDETIFNVCKYNVLYKGFDF